MVCIWSSLQLRVVFFDLPRLLWTMIFLNSCLANLLFSVIVAHYNRNFVPFFFPSIWQTIRDDCSVLVIEVSFNVYSKEMVPISLGFIWTFGTERRDWEKLYMFFWFNFLSVFLYIFFFWCQNGALYEYPWLNPTLLVLLVILIQVMWGF